jgi:hypothetical protein
VLVAAIADALLVQWLASVFGVEARTLGALGLFTRATVSALVGGLLFTLVDRRLQRLSP